MIQNEKKNIRIQIMHTIMHRDYHYHYHLSLAATIYHHICKDIHTHSPEHLYNLSITFCSLFFIFISVLIINIDIILIFTKFAFIRFPFVSKTTTQCIMICHLSSSNCLVIHFVFWHPFVELNKENEGRETKTEKIKRILFQQFKCSCKSFF